MKTNKFGEIIFDSTDLCDLLMQGRDVPAMPNVTVDTSCDIEKMIGLVEEPGQMFTWTFPTGSDISVPDYDSLQQRDWFMPEDYKTMDIAAYVLGLCTTQDQLQRCGEELLLYQERNLFDLLRYLKYLVDVMEENRIIWGVGRGSSVSSYVLFKLKVHRIDSMFYDLDIKEFLR